MQIGFKFSNCRGFGALYEYGYKYTHMITKTAKQRLKILQFWRHHGLKATTDAFGAKRSTLYYWWKIYKDSGYKVASLDPGSQAPKKRKKRIIHHLILKEIRRLRLEVCPNMGKAKVKKDLDLFCTKQGLKIISESTIGRIIKEKKIYHHRQKLSHFGKIKTVQRTKKLRKPKGFKVNVPGELLELDTIVKYIHGFKRYIITAVDTYSRYSFSWAYNRANSANTKDFFQKLKVVTPFEIKSIQTDNGSEFHKHFSKHLKEQNITHYFNYAGQPYKQGHIEKYNRTMQEEFIDWHEISLENTQQFNRKLMDWLIWYNTKRYHWGLNLESPVDYLLKNNHLSRMRWTNTLY